MTHMVMSAVSCLILALVVDGLVWRSVGALFVAGIVLGWLVAVFI